MSNFTATRAGKTIAVTTGSAPAVPISDDATASGATEVLVDCRGDYDVAFMFGGPDVTVTWATGIRIPAGSVAPFGKGSATHIAVIAKDGASSVTLHVGTGV